MSSVEAATGALTYPFELDRFQLEATEAIDGGRSVLVAAPTGAGKTVVAEHAVRVALAGGKRVFYTAPIKALSNQKYSDLVAEHGPKVVGLLTGDNAINPSAPVVVMTTEVLRNMIYADSPDLGDLGWVILDEVHYLQDPYRGPVWEEVIIHAPPAVRFVCLSATVSNVNEICSWIGELRGSVQAVTETRRPVSLDSLVCFGDNERTNLRFLPVFVGDRPNPEGERFDRDRRRRRGAGGRRWRAPDRVAVIEALSRRRMLPAIYFIFSRAGCDDAARIVARAGLELTTPAEQDLITEVVEPYVASLGRNDRRAVGYETWSAQILNGVAAHHAGMLPPFKEATEACFRRGLIKVVFATETLSLGINMPARTVVIERLTKFSGDGHELLTPLSYTQLTGRAGRRGIDDQGYAVVLWGPRLRFGDVAGLAGNRTFTLVSAFRPTYNMVVNLIARLAPEEARSVLGRSLAQYQADHEVVTLERQLQEGRRALAEINATARRRGSADAERRRRRTARRVEDLRNRLRSKKDTLATEFDELTEVLRRRGHLDGWELARSGTVLAGIYHESDLLITEALMGGHFDGLDEPSFAALLACCTYEPRGGDVAVEPHWPTASLRRSWARLGEAHDSLTATEAACLGRPRTRSPDGGFAAAAYAWAAGTPLAGVLDDHTTPGDFVRNVKLVCDLARQIGRVASDPATTAGAAAVANAMFRGVVSASVLDAAG
ncbi:MAG: DEAD/DEAH box helicase [Acidimicrobiia bacterium]|nr:DEAD/DEAH box helicase [Acidimicrobiia bacterium]